MSSATTVFTCARIHVFVSRATGRYEKSKTVINLLNNTKEIQLYKDSLVKWSRPYASRDRIHICAEKFFIRDQRHRLIYGPVESPSGNMIFSGRVE